MDMEEYVELQDKTIEENKNSYEIKDGVRYINIANCNRMYWNATSIIEILRDDLENIDNHLNHLSFSKFNKMLCRIINNYQFNDMDKKIKEWFVRNNREWNNVYGVGRINNREFNKKIRSNYVFYYKNECGQLYK